MSLLVPSVRLVVPLGMHIAPYNLLKASEFFFAKVTKQSNPYLISVVMGTRLDSHNDQGLQH